MICSPHYAATSRAEAGHAMRQLNLSKKYAEFGFGTSAPPLENPAQARPRVDEMGFESMYPDPPGYLSNSPPLLAPATPRKGKKVTFVDSEEYQQGEILSPNPSTKLGRRLISVGRDGRPSHAVTGGVVIQIQDRFFQLTVDHITKDPDTFPTQLHPKHSDPHHYPGRNVDEEDGNFEPDYDGMHRGVLTPMEQEPSWDECVADDRDFGRAASRLSPGEALSIASRSPHYASPRSSDGAPRGPTSWSAAEPSRSDATRVGAIYYRSRNGSRPNLDYALISVGPPGKVATNELVVGHGTTSKTLSIRRLAQFRTQEMRVLVAAADSGIMKGVIAPGPAHLRRSAMSPLQKLYTVHLEGVAAEGDCGAAVVDENTGDLYGHVVRGCPGTNLAYLVPAMEVFDDIRSHAGVDVMLASAETARHVEARVQAKEFMVPFASFPVSSVASTSADTPRADFDEPILPPEWAGASSLGWGGTHQRAEYLTPEFEYYPDFQDNETKQTNFDPSFILPGALDYQTVSYQYPHSPSIVSVLGAGEEISAPRVLPEIVPQYIPIPPLSSNHRIGLDSPSRATSSGRDEPNAPKKKCPLPGCGRTFRDLRAHILTHQEDRPEKCPITTCEYHSRGFARKYDKNRHTLTHYRGTLVCSFCPGSGPGAASAKSFNRADVFKRHLTSVHGVEQSPPSGRKRPGMGAGRDGAALQGDCTTCGHTFANAQEFYEHLDDCILGVIREEDALQHAVRKLGQQQPPPPSASGSRVPVKEEPRPEDDYDSTLAESRAKRRRSSGGAGSVKRRRGGGRP